MKIYKYLILSAVLLTFIPEIGFSSSSIQSVTPNPGSDNATADDQRRNAVQPIGSTSFILMDIFAAYMGDGNMVQQLRDNIDTRGIQFKNPVVSPGFSYRWLDDNAPGGFGGDELSGNVNFDADVYDGLIMGVVYQHTHRNARNVLATSERMESDGVSLYGAKRFFNLLNVGLSYNYADTEHRLTRAITSNLDRDSNGFSMFAGLSDRKGKWGWSTTTSFGYVNDDYKDQKDLDTGRFGWGGSLGYDVTKIFTLGGAFNYYTFVIQDVFPNTSVRDDDYYTVGPRFTFYPKEDLTVHLDFDSIQGYKDLASYTLRLGVDVAF